MSLTAEEQDRTRQELKENFQATGLSLTAAAAELQTTPQRIANILDLDLQAIEEPWILRNFILEKLAQQQKKASFTVLTGDYHRLWFLNSRKIDKRKLD